MKDGYDDATVGDHPSGEEQPARKPLRKRLRSFAGRLRSRELVLMPPGTAGNLTEPPGPSRSAISRKYLGTSSPQGVPRYFRTATWRKVLSSSFSGRSHQCYSPRSWRAPLPGRPGCKNAGHRVRSRFSHSCKCFPNLRVWHAQVYESIQASLAFQQFHKKQSQQDEYIWIP